MHSRVYHLNRMHRWWHWSEEKLNVGDIKVHQRSSPLPEIPIEKDCPKWCVNQLAVGAKSLMHSHKHILEEQIVGDTCLKEVRKHHFPLQF